MPKRVESPTAQYAEHRARLLDAMAEAVRGAGLRGSTVADVVRVARVSRRTFYQHFDDLDDCYLTLVTQRSEDLIERIRATVLADGSTTERIERGVALWLGDLAADPHLYLSIWRELHTTGEAGRGADASLTARWIRLYQQLGSAVRAAEGRTDPLPREVAVMVEGATRGLLLDVMTREQPVERIAPRLTWLLRLFASADTVGVDAAPDAASA